MLVTVDDRSTVSTDVARVVPVSVICSTTVVTIDVVTVIECVGVWTRQLQAGSMMEFSRFEKMPGPSMSV